MNPPRFLPRAGTVGILLVGLVALLDLASILDPPRALAAKKRAVKLATLAPDGSAWFKILREMGQAWQEETDGRIRLRIYPGGVAGDDTDMVRKMRIGQLQAGALTSAGLASIDDAFNVFSVPLFFDSYEEFLFVRERMTPLLSKRLEAKGFVLLCWGDAGWVHLMTTKRFETVDGLKKLKIWTWAGNDRMVKVWKSNGYTPVALSSTDILVGLQTGLIDGLPTTPYASVALQYFRQTKYFFDLGLGPLNGAILMVKKTWDGIPEEDRALLLEAAATAQERIQVEIPQRDREAVEEMKERGVEIVYIDSPEEEARWRREAEKFAEAMKGVMFPEEMLTLAVEYRAEYRQEEQSGK